MTLFELGILFLTTGVVTAGFAALCSAFLDRLGRGLQPQPAAGQRPQSRR